MPGTSDLYCRLWALRVLEKKFQAGADALSKKDVLCQGFCFRKWMLAARGKKLCSQEHYRKLKIGLIHWRRCLLRKCLTSWRLCARLQNLVSDSSYVIVLKRRVLNRLLQACQEGMCLREKLDRRHSLMVMSRAWKVWLLRSAKQRTSCLSQYFTRWKQVTVRNRRLLRVQAKVELLVCRRMFRVWRHQYCLQERQSLKNMAGRVKVLVLCWQHWESYVVDRRVKKRLNDVARVHFEEHILVNFFTSWKELTVSSRSTSRVCKKLLTQKAFRKWKMFTVHSRLHHQWHFQLAQSFHSAHVLADAFQSWKVELNERRSDRMRIIHLKRRAFLIWILCWKRRRLQRRLARRHHRKVLLRRFILKWNLAVARNDTLLHQADASLQKRILKKSFATWLTSMKRSIAQKNYETTRRRRCLQAALRRWQWRLQVHVFTKSHRADHLSRKYGRKWLRKIRRSRLEEVRRNLWMHRQKSLILRASFRRWVFRSEEEAGQQARALATREVLNMGKLERTFHAWCIVWQEGRLIAPFIKRLQTKALVRHFDVWRLLTVRQSVSVRYCHVKEQEILRSSFNIWSKKAMLLREQRTIALNENDRVTRYCLQSWQAYVSLCKRRRQMVIESCVRHWRSFTESARDAKELALVAKARTLIAYKSSWSVWTSRFRLFKERGEADHCRAKRAYEMLLQKRCLAVWTRKARVEEVIRVHLDKKRLETSGRVFSAWLGYSREQMRDSVDRFVNRFEHSRCSTPCSRLSSPHRSSSSPATAYCARMPRSAPTTPRHGSRHDSASPSSASVLATSDCVYDSDYEQSTVAFYDSSPESSARLPLSLDDRVPVIKSSSCRSSSCAGACQYLFALHDGLPRKAQSIDSCPVERRKPRVSVKRVNRSLLQSSLSMPTLYAPVDDQHPLSTTRRLFGSMSSLSVLHRRCASDLSTSCSSGIYATPRGPVVPCARGIGDALTQSTSGLPLEDRAPSTFNVQAVKEDSLDLIGLLARPEESTSAGVTSLLPRQPSVPEVLTRSLTFIRQASLDDPTLLTSGLYSYESDDDVSLQSFCSNTSHYSREHFLVSTLRHWKMHDVSVPFNAWLKFATQRTHRRSLQEYLAKRKAVLLTHGALQIWWRWTYCTLMARKFDRSRCLSTALKAFVMNAQGKKRDAGRSLVAGSYRRRTLLVHFFIRWKRQHRARHLAVKYFTLWRACATTDERHRVLVSEFTRASERRILARSLRLWISARTKLAAADEKANRVFVARCFARWFRYHQICSNSSRLTTARATLAIRQVWCVWRRQLESSNKAEDMRRNRDVNVASQLLTRWMILAKEGAAKKARLVSLRHTLRLRLQRDAFGVWRLLHAKWRLASAIQTRNVVARIFQLWLVYTTRRKEFKKITMFIRLRHDHMQVVHAFSKWRVAVVTRRLVVRIRCREASQLLRASFKRWRKATSKARARDKAHRLALRRFLCKWQSQLAARRFRDQCTRQAFARWRQFALRCNMSTQRAQNFSSQLRKEKLRQFFGRWTDALGAERRASHHHSEQLLRRGMDSWKMHTLEANRCVQAVDKLRESIVRRQVRTAFSVWRANRRHVGDLRQKKAVQMLIADRHFSRQLISFTFRSWRSSIRLRKMETRRRLGLESKFGRQWYYSTVAITNADELYREKLLSWSWKMWRLAVARQRSIRAMEAFDKKKLLSEVFCAWFNYTEVHRRIPEHHRTMSLTSAYRSWMKAFNERL